MNNTIRTSGTGIRDSMGLLAGLIIGGLAGFGTMMLLAPQSGQKTSPPVREKRAALQGGLDTGTFDDLLGVPLFDVSSGLKTEEQTVDEGSLGQHC
jgi:hypothetical protein